MNESGVSRDRDILRRLAAEVREIAERPEQKRKIELWTKLNDLRPERPMVWITEIPWGEFENVEPELRLMCESPEARPMERRLRHILYTARHFPCDEVVEPCWRVHAVVRGADYGVHVQEQTISQGGSYVRSHHYEPVIRTIEDVEKVRMPRIEYDRAATEQTAARVEEWIGDILPARITGARLYGFHPWDTLVQWTGVTEALEALYEAPEFLHALLRRMTDSILSRLDQIEALGLLDTAMEAPRVGSGGAGYTTDLPAPGANPKAWRARDAWGFSTAQIFADVSPEMHWEFSLQYEIEYLERFGLNYYGCCEPLHNKMALLGRIPRLRKISISPWCDVAQARADAPHRMVFSHKPSPAVFASDTYESAAAEAELRRRLKESGDMPCEIIMKDISTVRGDPWRLTMWCRMAIALAQEAAT